MNAHDEVVWLHRRAGFGLASTAMAAAVGRGAAAEMERLLAPATMADAWDDSRLPFDPMDRPSKAYAIQGWLDALVAAEAPLAERMAWVWHGHFVSALDKVRVARLMVQQVRLFRTTGLGPFRDLLRAVTIDPAMLLYLDLRTSTGEQPNENYSRELLELFTLGEGNYTEDDVQAGAKALTGWTIERDTGGVLLRPRRHDDTAQHYLGAVGVHDLDTVVDAVMAHEALPRWIAGTLAWELLGVTDADLVARLADGFVASGFDVRTLVGEVLQAGLDGATAPIVLSPVPWYVIARRVTGATPDPRPVMVLLRSAGQLPMLPPSVAGWPGGVAWFASSSLVARADLAALVAAATPDGPVLAAADGADPQALADALGLPSAGFGAPSLAALAAAPAGRDRLAVALLTPEFVIA